MNFDTSTGFAVVHEFGLYRDDMKNSYSSRLKSGLVKFLSKFWKKKMKLLEKHVNVLAN
jgi:hypothetical protein